MTRIIKNVSRSGIFTNVQHLSRSVQGYLRMRDFMPPPPLQNDSAILGVLEKGYRRDAHTYFDANYVKRHGSVHRSAFWFRPPFSKKPAIFGIGRSENKRCIYSKSCIVNRQIWVWIPKKCYYFDPYSLVT